MSAVSTSRKRAVSHLVIPDTQVKPGVPTEHLHHVGKYIVDRKPDTVVMIGDWFDMPSLSSYDKGTKSFEGRRYKADINSGCEAMEMMLKPLKAMRKRPRLVFTKGNHEHRIERAVEADAKLEGTIGYHDLRLKDFGWEDYDFLDKVVIDGIAYSHYFPRSASGAISQTKRGAPNARAQLVREGGSCVAGHQQGLDMACAPLRGKLQWGIIAGSCYAHEEGYLSPQGTAYWRGVIALHEVADGYCDPMTVSLRYLKSKYA